LYGLKNFFIDKNDVEELKNSIIGIACKNSCNKTGVILSENVFLDCSCQKEFQNKVKLLIANIPKKYWDFDLRYLTEEFVKENKNSLLIIQQFRDKIDVAVKDGIGLYVQGDVGLAKSALSSYLLKYAIRKDVVAYSVRMSQLTKLIFDSLKEPESKMQMEWIKKEVQLLLIDEIEKDYKLNDLSQFAAIQANDFFGMLYEKKKSLIVTSNVSKEGLRQSHPANIVDRLEELIDVVFTGNSYRRQDQALKKLFE